MWYKLLDKRGSEAHVGVSYRVGEGQAGFINSQVNFSQHSNIAPDVFTREAFIASREKTAAPARNQKQADEWVANFVRENKEAIDALADR